MHMPDSDGFLDIKPAADGKPWRKSCDVCAFRLSDPQMIGEAYQHKLRSHDGTSAFYCLHRGDDRHRICASYAAINRLSSSII